VECQFKSLQSCPRSEHHLDRMLKALPASLDETYERMLCNIDHDSIEDARRILTLLCFASRLLRVHELIDGIAVEITNGVGLNRKRRLQDANDIHGICPGLIQISLDSAPSPKILDEDDQPEYVPTLRIAHFSVQEYLESERIRHQQARMFSLSSATAHAETSQICLLYLLEPALSKTRSIKSIREAFPLGHYAAEFWYHHYQEAERPHRVNGIVTKLFQRQDSFMTWIRLHNIDDFIIDEERTGSPVYYASLLGLHQVLDELIYFKQQDNKPESSALLPRISCISKMISVESEYSSNV
jgi:hypothetical protein